MTERKPPDMSFPSWVDKQINEAAERGAFDNLPGAGKPLPKSDEADAGQAWLRDYLRREGVPTEEMLPIPLKLRKEIERLAETVHVLRSEQEVREVVAELNERITNWRRMPIGPPIFVPLADEEAMVGRWRAGQPVAQSDASRADAGHQAGDGQPARRRWWRRLGRRRSAASASASRRP
jgi:Domain of unknown function (DUF1992)